MIYARYLSATVTSAAFFLSILHVDARCVNLTSPGFAPCSPHNGAALDFVKAASTAPYPIRPLATGQATPKLSIEDKHQAAALKASSPPAELPLQNGTENSGLPDIKSLPPPTGTHVVTAWGTGTQNYSCPGPASPSATPTLIGAVADLFDADESSRPLIGHHYFNAAGNPTFDLSSGAMPDTGVLQTQKTKAGDITSPVKTAVDWLNLVSDGLGSGNLQEVYRVDTVGGKPAPGQCAGKAAGTIIAAPYSAYYWFYS